MRITYGKGFDVVPNAPAKVRFRETVLAAQQEMQQMESPQQQPQNQPEGI